MKKKSKISISLDKNLNDILDKEFSNKSKYIEYLIYQDMLKCSNNKKIKFILI
jgi:hypothetical protein